MFYLYLSAETSSFMHCNFVLKPFLKITLVYSELL